MAAAWVATADGVVNAVRGTVELAGSDCTALARCDGELVAVLDRRRLVRRSAAGR